MRTLLTALALALVLVASQAFAAAGTTAFGVKAGLNIASVHGDDADDMLPVGWDSRVAFSVGAFTEIPINGMLSFQPELLYAMKGAKATVEDVEITWKLSYIEIPMLFKVNVPMAGAARPFLVVGPEVGFKTTSKLAGEGGGYSVEMDLENVKGTDLGMIIGGGVGFPFMNRMACLEARYDLGLTTIVDVEDVDVKNNAISIMVGITF